MTGGGYTDSDEIPGHWGLAYKTVFVGETQPDNSYAFSGGPFNPTTASKTGIFNLACQLQKNNALASFCLDQNQGVSFPTSNFGGQSALLQHLRRPFVRGLQRLSGYKRRPRVWTARPTPQVVRPANGLRRDNLGLRGIKRYADDCYLPNAAIAWKQPNGFNAHPPAFHSDNLFFDNVDIRHYVISPLFQPNTFSTDPNKVKDHYCQQTPNMFDNWTDVDRQTELNDDDGSLTGIEDTISINLDPFFIAPVETVECESGPYLEPLDSGLPPGTVKTSPYDYVTTAIYPKCMARNPGGEVCNPTTPDPPPPPNWRVACADPSCYGVPIYRQYLTNEEKNGPPVPSPLPTPSIRLMGQSQAQRSGLTVNNGSYYIDTTVGPDTDPADQTYSRPATPTTRTSYSPNRIPSRLTRFM